MLRSFTLTSSFLATALLAGCLGADPVDDDDDGGGSGGSQSGTGGGNTGGQGGASGTGAGSSGAAGMSLTGGASGTSGAGGSTTGGTSGTAGTSGAAAGGASATGGTSGTAGSAGTGPVTCSNTDKTIIPVDMSGWVDRSCTDRMIQGAFYCYADGINPSTCVEGTPPYRAGAGMCIAGDTTLDPDHAAWGAGIGLSLNAVGDPAPAKMAYNAAANGVLGFTLSLSGDSGGNPLRVNFTTAEESAGVEPFWQLPAIAGAGDFEVLIADAIVPEAWMIPESGKKPDPAAIYDLQVQVAGGDLAAHYDVCITGVKPITDGSTPMTGPVMNYGAQNCTNLGVIPLGSRYAVQNNLYNAQGGSQCVTARWDNGDKAGLIVNPVNLNIEPGGPPGSYPSVVLGWHYGQFHGSYASAKQLSAISSVPSSWAFTVPTNGAYNASYDVWLHSSATNPPDTNGTLELMIWLNQRETTPIGTIVTPMIDIGGTQWAVWYGTHDGFSTVSYVRVTNTTSVTNLDLKPFFDDSVTRGYISNSGYLLGVQAGFEIWKQTMQMSSDSFSVSIN
jgi:hypothetical protein